MEDVELMERAAKAAALTLEESIYPGWFMCDGRQWNALADDGDALRLAVKLHLDVMTSCRLDEIQVGGAVKSTTFQPIEGDRLAATRRAIVRAAAAMVD
ncbi:hypothetical protein R69746_07740 [Paraburkholderia aspalathi]|uniref:hypothetical protein n=1 Tax=Paraburkholderia aspalathi TaxID=1324617 RepID=UPI00190A2E22|nr:hypothetical protein [Paraburkholderia aspalathi]MBK3843725.1 hypothetical protein [Paraburkholderia aspalathi]CAE6859474.1 hypothetical protein R69746_07740 [Paraburkholderia aspalathi]